MLVGLSGQAGHHAMGHHIHTAIGLMGASDDWGQMKQMVDRAFPERGESSPFAFLCRWLFFAKP